MIFLTKCWDHNSSSLNHHQIIRHLLGQYSSSLNHHQIIRHLFVHYSSSLNHHQIIKHLFGHYSSSFNHHQIIATVLGHSFVCSRSLSCFIWYVSRNIIRLLLILGLNAVWCAGIHHYQAIPATRTPFWLPHAPDGPPDSDSSPKGPRPFRHIYHVLQMRRWVEIYKLRCCF